MPLAKALARRGHTVHLALRDLSRTSDLLRACGGSVWQAPVFLHRVGGLPPVTVNLSEILAGVGYTHPDVVEGMTLGWLSLIDRLSIDLVLADYAPGAVLAAHLRGRPSMTLGLGFFVPPDATPLPSIVPWMAVPAQRLSGADAAVLRSVNRVCEQLGGPPMRSVAQLLRGDHPMLTTWPELDHFDPALRTAADSFIGPNEDPADGMAPQWPAGDGPRVTAYLKAAHPLHAQVLQALVAHGCRVACYMPEVASGKPAPVSAATLWYAPRPLLLREALDGSRLLVCHAGHGTMIQALRARVPMLLVPMQNEQALIARRVHALGWGFDALTLGERPDFRSSIRTALALGPLPDVLAGRRDDCTQSVLDRVATLLGSQPD